MDAVYTRYRDNPSFSSTLLDEIYRSIDERDDEQSKSCRKTKLTKFGGPDCFQGDFDERRACLIQKWMENEVCEKPVVVGRKSAAADLDKSSIRCERDSMCFNSSSSSSDSSYGGGGGFSSSEGELFRPRPIRTGIHQRDGFVKRENERSSYGHGDDHHHDLEQKVKHESKFVKTKSKALKIYSDLKKVKQPISPGGRLSTFLNSLFITGNTKKSKTSSATFSGNGGCADAAESRLDRKSKSANASTCSSTSSFSRSCLSNTPSSRGKLSNGLKRSVRFYPVSEIVDEYCQPCGHKSLDEEETGLQSVKFVKNSFNEDLQIKQTARNLLKSYQKKIDCEFNSKHTTENDDDVNCSDDGKSDSSSDLFELDNLVANEIHKYREELPVYETTHLDTNRAIANGLTRLLKT